MAQHLNLRNIVETSLWNPVWERRRTLASAVRMLALPAAVWLSIFAGQGSFAQSPNPTPKPAASDLNRVAPATAAPPFQLPDAKGTPRSLASFRGAPAVLVFYRGSW